MPSHERPRKSSQGALFIALGIVSLLASVFFFLDYAIEHAHTMHFQYEGHDVSGRIDDLSWQNRPFPTLYITYSYADALGNTHHGIDSYPFKDAAEIKAGQGIDVLYLDYNPDKSRLAAKQSLMMVKLKDAPWQLIGYIALGGLLALGIGIRKRRR